jgi:hypothetical protein
MVANLNSLLEFMLKYEVIAISGYILIVMSTFSKEEYLELVRNLTNQQYDELSDEEEDWIEWMPAEPQIKEKLTRVRGNEVTDLTNIKKAQIPDLLYKTSTIKVHNFTIKISTFHGDMDGDEANLTVDFTLYQEVYQTPNLKAPCKMTYSCNVFKESRFEGRPWLKYFDQQTGSHGTKVPTATLIDIVRWIQVAVKYPAFL